jgi:CDP-diacylglycerol--serine O-phosphatidyltransferase
MEQPIKLFTIPNFITSMSIVCGFTAIIIGLENPENLVYSALLIGLASIFDYADGFVARALKAYSAIGKELDSLADMVSFGLAPGVIIYQFLKISMTHTTQFDLSFMGPNTLQAIFIVAISVLIPIFSALRLAKFNIDTRQTTSFVGLPTPANAILIASLPVILYFHGGSDFLDSLILNVWFLCLLTFFESFMLVVEFPMFSLKFKNFSFSDNKIRYYFLGMALLLIILFKFIAIPLIIIAFILFSGFNNFYTKYSKPNA